MSVVSSNFISSLFYYRSYLIRWLASRAEVFSSSKSHAIILSFSIYLPNCIISGRSIIVWFRTGRNGLRISFVNISCCSLKLFLNYFNSSFIRSFSSWKACYYPGLIYNYVKSWLSSIILFNYLRIASIHISICDCSSPRLFLYWTILCLRRMICCRSWLNFSRNWIAYSLNGKVAHSSSYCRLTTTPDFR